MKSKLSKLLLTIILVLPIVVFADGAGPVFNPYNAYVNDLNGASLYDEDFDGETVFSKTDIVLDYKTDVKILDEIEVSKGNVYGRLRYEKNNDDEENYDYYYINLDKLSLYKDEYTLDDFKKELQYLQEDGSEIDVSDITAIKKEKMIIYSDEVEVYSGPSTKYNKRDFTLKKDEIVDYYWSYTEWLYIEKNDTFGWIQKTKCNYLTEGPSLWLIEDTVAYDMPKFEKLTKTDVKIPKGEKFEETFYLLYTDYNKGEPVDYEYYRVVYNDNVYYVSKDTNKIATSDSDRFDSNKVVTPKKVDVYDKMGGKKVETIPVNKKFDVEYFCEYYDKKDNYYSWVYLEYNNKKYWAKSEDFAVNKDTPTINIVETEYYDVPNGTVVDKLPANTEFNNYYDYYDNNGNSLWYGVEINNNIYWIDEDYFSEEKYEEYDCFSYEEDKPIYTDVKNNITNKTLPKNTKICPKYRYHKNDHKGKEEIWFYIKNNNYEGWTDYYGVVPKAIESNNNQNVTNEPDVVVVDNKLSKKELILICTFGAIVLGLVIVVTIVLINKKKKKENIQTETVVESTDTSVETIPVEETPATLEEQQSEENQDA